MSFPIIWPSTWWPSQTEDSQTFIVILSLTEGIKSRVWRKCKSWLVYRYSEPWYLAVCVFVRFYVDYTKAGVEPYKFSSCFCFHWRRE